MSAGFSLGSLLGAPASSFEHNGIITNANNNKDLLRDDRRVLGAFGIGYSSFALAY
ncbi:MAG: hypothetical protein JKY04_07800 [Sneathiella sp.]|nr:hypothetical protein [Sneathiella sp.]